MEKIKMVLKHKGGVKKAVSELKQKQQDSTTHLERYPWTLAIMRLKSLHRMFSQYLASNDQSGAKKNFSKK